MHTIDVHEVQGHQVVTNPGGLGLFERLDRLETEFRDTQSELAAIKSELKPIKSLLYDAREREYVTHLRDFCDDYGIPRHSRMKKTNLQREVSSRVEALNSGRVHAGNALADAEMFAARRPFNSVTQFRKIYGLNADQIKELSKRFRLSAVLLSLLTHSFKSLGAHDYASLLQILDAVGTSRYQGRTMKEEEEGLFKEMIELVDARNFDRAEEAAKSAIEGNKFYRPFVPWPAEWDDVEEREG